MQGLGPLPLLRGARPLAVALALALLAPVGRGQDGRPDKVMRLNPRTEKLTTLSGHIVEDSLARVRWTKGGREEDVPSVEVVRVVWGEAPASFQDGRTYAGRGDHENAVASYRTAAGDDSAREVVRAVARLRVAEELLSWGASDPSRFAECASECERYLADHPGSRGVPRARWLQARATLLAGDPAKAAELFAALYGEGAREPATEGYSRAECARAGLDAAEAYLAAGDVAAARELYGALEGVFASLVAAAPENSTRRSRLDAGQGVAATGEGACLLTEGQTDKAVRFFQERIDRPDLHPGERYAALLGLAQAEVTQGSDRAAQIHFATVSAIDYTDRDRAARALVGLANVTVRLADADATRSARTWLEQVRTVYGDTPAAAAAAEMLKTL